MSIECGECERDLRSGHDESCSRNPQNKGKSEPKKSPLAVGDKAAITGIVVIEEIEGEEAVVRFNGDGYKYCVPINLLIPFTQPPKISRKG